MRRALLCGSFLGALCVAPAARADIYRVVQDGQVLYTNIRPTSGAYSRIIKSSKRAKVRQATRQTKAAPTTTTSTATVPTFASAMRDGETTVRGSDETLGKERHCPLDVLQRGLNEYADTIKFASQAYDVPEALIRAVIQVESCFKPEALSRKGARGLMQLMPNTARKLGVRNAGDPHQNILAGTRYLKKQIERHNGDLVLALSSYNAGPGAVGQYLERDNTLPPYRETRGYVVRVLRLYYRGEGFLNSGEAGAASADARARADVDKAL